MKAPCSLLCFTLVALLGCGSAPPSNSSGASGTSSSGSSSRTENVPAVSDSGEAPASVPELLCGQDLPGWCGVDRPSCEAGVAPILQTCLGEMTDLLPESPSAEQRERAVMMATLCTIHVYRQRRALDGHACGGQEVEEDLQRLCLICSVASGTVRSVPSTPRTAPKLGRRTFAPVRAGSRPGPAPLTPIPLTPPCGR